jgi:hypothetical protein
VSGSMVSTMLWTLRQTAVRNSCPGLVAVFPRPAKIGPVRRVSRRTLAQI